MAPPRTFDYDLLKRLVRDHPEQSYARYAEILTDDARQQDPYAPPVLPDSIRRVVSQYRDRWEDEGVKVPDRKLGADIRVPLAGVSENYWMATPVRYLREIWNERNGRPALSDGTAKIRRAALRWEGRLRETREIVDITSLGEVIVRPAVPDELDEDGNLAEISAWAVPGLAPARRATRRGRG
jgi:hypothetical protein